MVEKLKLPEDKIGIPECINCFSRITDHVNVVMGSFEVSSNELFDDFHKKAAESLRETATRTDFTVQEHFRKQELKEDAAMSDHFEKQSLKYDEFEKKVFGLIWKVFAFFGAVAIVASGVVGATWVSNQQKADKTALEVTDKKFEKYMTLQAAKDIHMVRDAYYRDIFLSNPNSKVDSTNYNWIIKTLFGGVTRGSDGIWYKNQEPFKSENSNKN